MTLGRLSFGCLSFPQYIRFLDVHAIVTPLRKGNMSSESEDGGEKNEVRVLGEDASVAGRLESPRSDSAADRKAFLASFTSEEDKAIRRKVDWKFLWLIGLMYVIKNVSY